MNRDPTPKRPIPFWRLFLRGWGWITVIALPMLVVTVGVAAYSGYYAVRLALEGVETKAQITAKQRFDSDGDSRTDGHENYFVEFAFTADGETIADRARVSEDFSHSVRTHDTVPLRYARSKPLLNEIEPGAHVSEMRKSLFWLVVLIVVAGPILRQHWKKAKTMIWVRDYGEARKVVVVSHESTGIEVNDRTAFRLHWKDENGATGRTTMVNRHALDRYPVGSELVVYFDPIKGHPPIWQVEVGPPDTRE